MEHDELLMAILNSDCEGEYPPEFLADYDIMECLSEQNGIITFLVQDHSGESYIAKCYDRSLWNISDKSDLLAGLDHKGLPRHLTAFKDEKSLVTIREYVDGIPLNRYARENDLSEKEIIRICIELCDILAYLHHRQEPIIHRDIKPQNIIIRPDGSVVLIDFDIARIYRTGHDTDTIFFGTRAYAPPEQYGFSQTDARTDIYALGILLRWMLTGSTRDNKKITIYKPLAKIIRKATGFAPKERFSDAEQVKKALLAANPRAQRIRTAAIFICVCGIVFCVGYGGWRLYRRMTYTPFSKDAIPAYLSDQDRVQEAAAYMKKKYSTSIFDHADEIATVGDLRTVMIDLYGLDHDYVYGINKDIPQESDDYFLPWGWDDKQTLDRDIAVYAAVKVHDPSIVADWSDIKDDNGFYPGVRAAMVFAEKTGIMTGANQPGDIPMGDFALILANADRVFGAAEK